MYRKLDPGFPAHTTPYNHFLSKAAMLDKLAHWVKTNGDFCDVAAILAERRTSTPPTMRAVVNEGFVYLIQSGAHYKIGRSDQLERRVKEIRIALPEAATLVHAIRTDDPTGIEAYWHRRFADRRANGEWFKLGPSDVAAFKRRKYQ
jgi:hypothetical protein